MQRQQDGLDSILELKLGRNKGGVSGGVLLVNLAGVREREKGKLEDAPVSEAALRPVESIC